MIPAEPNPIFSRQELAAIRAQVEGGAAPRCPRCEVALVSQGVPRPPQVSYVRNRTWYLCPSCRASAVLDR